VSLRSAFKNLVMELLVELLKAYSPTFQESEATEVLKEFTESKLNFDTVHTDSVGNLIASYGEGSVSVALIGHIDTVPGYIPVRTEGGTIWGRGAVDAKGPLAAAFVGASLAREMIADEELKVYAISLVGEEGPSHGAWNLVKEDFRSDYVVICEPSNTTDVVVEYRGSALVVIRCYSKGGHTSSPHAGESACDKLISTWIAIKELFSGTSASEFTSALTRLACGEGGPVLPREGFMEVNVRVPHGYGESDFRKLISELSLPKNCYLTITSFTEPVKVPVNSLIVRATYRALLKQGIRPRLARKLGTSDMNVLYDRVSNEIVAYGPGDPALSHSDEEYVRVSDLVLGALIYANIIKELSELSTRR